MLAAVIAFEFTFSSPDVDAGLQASSGGENV
jgi:hypothetical protein